MPDDRGTLFNVDGVYLFVGFHDKVTKQAKDPYRIMPGFVVDSVFDVYNELKEKNVTFIRLPSLSPDGKYYAATATDPEGNIIQFFSYNK